VGLPPGACDVAAVADLGVADGHALEAGLASHSRDGGARTSPASSSRGYDTIACGCGAIAAKTSRPFRSRIATPFSPATNAPWIDV
jgi:hypothetical protein